MSKADDKINSEMLMLEEDHAPRNGPSLNQSEAEKLLIIGSYKPYIPDLNKEPYSDSEGRDKEKTLILCDVKAENTNDRAPNLLIVGSSSPYILDLNEEPRSHWEGEDEEITKVLTYKAQDANDCAPKLLYELLVEIFARISCSEYWKLQFLNKRFSNLLKSGEIFRVRKERGLVKPYVFMLNTSAGCWTMFDHDFKNFQKLPELPSDCCFLCSDKETICAGTQLIVTGRETMRNEVWRYEMEMFKWVKGPAMITPRCMFGSASHGTDAFFAGGIKTSENWVREVVSIAEKYNADTKTWTSIREMHKRRKFSTGCFFRGKFCVIGGQDENEHYLTCGEMYDEVTNSWKLIPDMIKGMSTPLSPRLIAVVNDNLYMLETVLNELLVYDINTNVWKTLGVVPVRTNLYGGNGVAFKSIGDGILLIGGLNSRGMSPRMSLFTCRPSTNIKEIIWEKLNDYSRPGVRFHHFIHNCCVMFV